MKAAQYSGSLHEKVPLQENYVNYYSDVYLLRKYYSAGTLQDMDSGFLPFPIRTQWTYNKICYVTLMNYLVYVSINVKRMNCIYTPRYYLPRLLKMR